MWRDRRILDLFAIEHPIVQAPMAGAQGSAMAVAVSNTGALGSLPCALLSPDQLRFELQAIRRQTDKPFNLNFFCHAPPAPEPEREANWIAKLAPYRAELGVVEPTVKGGRAPFDDAACALIEESARISSAFTSASPASTSSIA